MSGILYLMFYNTACTIDKLSLLIHASSFEEAIAKGERLLERAGQDMEGVEIMGLEKIV